MEREDVKRDATFWLLLSVSVGSGIAIADAFVLYAFRSTVSSIIVLDAIALGFVAVPILTRSTRQADILTKRRVAALFGVIPAIATVAALLMLALGLRLAILYVFPALILGGNFVYWLWFDRPRS